ncbi:MAG: FkbM family methyltransferase [Halioglobus sp.]
MSRLEKLASKLGAFLCNYRGRVFADRINASVHCLHQAINNVNYDMDTNGEFRALSIILENNNRCVFDVGANIGLWTQEVKSLAPNCDMHSFEIVPSTFQQLKKNTSDLQGVKINDVGLSDETGEIQINLGKYSTSSTAFKIDALKFHDNYYTDQVTCKTILGSSYLESNGIESVDLLKIDTEGMDLRVIRGFDLLLDRVKIIQFEYGIFNISSHDLLGDYCHYLDKKGFRVGKIFPRHVDFFNYNWRNENFYGGNYLAVRKSNQKLINALKANSSNN